MESRMEKYYRENPEYYKRSKRNADLYKDIDNNINDLENLPIPDNSNEIDINGLKQIISSRDEYRKAKDMGRTITRKSVEEEPIEEKRRVYDINVLLETAKNEVNKNNEVEGKKLINANFLTDLDDANVPSNDFVEVSEVTSEKEKEVSNTDSLPLDILVDLKGTDNTVVTDPIVKDEVTMIEKIKDGETFYSGSFNFTKKDFADEDDDDLFEEKSHTGVKVFFLIVGLLLLAGVIYLAITKYVLWWRNYWEVNIKKLEDGVYSISGKMLKTDKKTESMANEAINHKIKLTVKNGKYDITLDFKGLNISSSYGYLSKIKYFTNTYKIDQYKVPTGSLKNVTVDSYQKDTKGNPQDTGRLWAGNKKGVGRQ